MATAAIVKQQRPEDVSGQTGDVLCLTDAGASTYRIAAIEHPAGGYVYSVWMKAASAMTVLVNALGVNGVCDVTTAWQRFTVKVPEATPANKAVDIMPGSNAALYLYKSLLEYGNTATDWTPAPEDVDNALSALRVDLQQQIDGKIETWYQSSDPATWSDTDRDKHVGDLWAYTGTTNATYTKGATYKYTKSGSTYSWVQSSASDGLLDKVDGKRTIYYGTTSGSYPKVETDDYLVDSTDGSTYRWSGSAWVKATDYCTSTKNLLLDTTAPSETKIAANYNRYFSSGSTSHVVPSFQTRNDLPIPGNTVTQYIVPTAVSNGTHRSLTWFSGGFVPMVDNQAYTVSCYARLTSGTTGRLVFQYGSSPYKSSYIEFTNTEWRRYSWTFTYRNSDTGGSNRTRIYIGIHPKYACTAELCGYKLELGTTMTPWEPAPEDLDDILHSDVLDVTHGDVTLKAPDNVFWRVNSTEAGWYRTVNGVTKRFAAIGVDGDEGYLAANQLRCPDPDVKAHMKAEFGSGNRFQMNFMVPKYSGASSTPNGTIGSMAIGAYTGSEYDGSEYSNDFDNYLTASEKLDIYCYRKTGNAEVGLGEITINAESAPGLKLYSFEPGSGRGCSLQGYDCTGSQNSNWECVGSIVPDVSDSYNLGVSGHRWNAAYIKTVHEGSDRRIKKDITDIRDAERFIMDLRPRQYRMKDDDGKVHMGFIAQEVAEVMPEKFGGYDGDDPDNLYLAYSEFIAPLVSLVQQQQRMITMLTGRCESLEERINRLEQMNRG